MWCMQCNTSFYNHSIGKQQTTDNSAVQYDTQAQFTLGPLNISLFILKILTFKNNYLVMFSEIIELNHL